MIIVAPKRGRAPTGNAGALVRQLMVIVEKSTNQLFGRTKPLILGLMARGPTSCATHRKAASSTERSCKAASALSRSAGSKAVRTAATSLSNSGSLMKPQLFDTGGASFESRKRIMGKKGALAGEGNLGGGGAG